MKVNEGEVPQYYVENSHPAIISPAQFDMVQDEIARRKKLGRSYSGMSVFASKVICGDCGGFYGKKVWHSTDIYRREIWRCNAKFKGSNKCSTPALDAEVIKQAYLKAYNELMGTRDEVIAACEAMRTLVGNLTALEADIEALEDELQVVSELVNQCVKENATTAQSQDEYAKKYNSLVKRYEKASTALQKATAERQSKLERDRQLRAFIGALREQPLVMEEWSEDLWITLLDTATVYHDGRIVFLFKNGSTIAVKS